jgi:hypothetical protein
LKFLQAQKRILGRKTESKFVTKIESIISLEASQGGRHGFDPGRPLQNFHTISTHLVAAWLFFSAKTESGQNGSML